MRTPEFSLIYSGTPMHFCGDGTHVVDGTLTVTAEYTVYPEFNAAKWLLRFKNPGTEKSRVITGIRDCNTVLPFAYPERRVGHCAKEGDPCVIAMKGIVNNDGSIYGTDDTLSATEFSLSHRYLTPIHPIHLQSEDGRSSNGAAPFFHVTCCGRGAVCAVGWTGDWTADISMEVEGIRIETGLKNAGFYLNPGEELRTTSFLIMEYAEGEDANNKFRALMRKYNSHKTAMPETRDGLLAFELWGGLPSEEMIRRLGELKAHGYRFEDLWIDAGWYGQCTDCTNPFTGDWAIYTGDWEINRRVHPKGMEDVRDAATDTGLSMMLWVEPERATTHTKAWQQHPEWFLTPPEFNRDGSALLYYGNEEAWQYIFDLLDGYVTRFAMRCYRQDFNMPIAAICEKHDEPDRRGITEIYHITGMYRLWDALQKKHPGLLIDNCSSGGRRIDMETLQRSIAFFRSDFQCGFNANSNVLQAHNAGISQLLPYNGCTTKICDLYDLRSAYSSSWGVAFYNAVFQSMDEEKWVIGKKACDDYLRIRKYLPLNFYNHGSVTAESTAWAIFQYHDPEENEGVVLAFRRENAPFDTATLQLKGVTGAVTCENLDSGEEYTTDAERFTVSLPEKRSSVIIVYKA